MITRLSLILAMINMNTILLLPEPRDLFKALQKGTEYTPTPLRMQKNWQGNSIL